MVVLELDFETKDFVVEKYRLEFLQTCVMSFLVHIEDQPCPKTRNSRSLE